MGFSIKQKIDVCLMAEANPEMTQTDLAVWAYKRFNTPKPPSQTTISRILARKDELIALKEHEFKLIRRRRSTNPLLRKVLTEWITQCVWSNIPITAPIIISSANNFWKQCPPNMRDGSGEFSFRWCSQFLAKVNINLATIEKDLYSNRLKVWTFEERDELKNLLQGVDPKKIFTLGEIFLSHDLPLDKAFYNDSSDFITCMLCVNADGSEKLDPLIVGRYENYPYFEGRSSAKAANKHGVAYHSNRMKWLTSTMFYDWLSVLDKRLALQDRDIIIVLDDSASHRVVNIKLQRIRLLYTSSNSNFLPTNWGIEGDIRLNYRIKQYEKLLQKQVLMKDKLLTKDEQTFNMCETFDLIKHAWNSVPIERIKSAWKQSGVLPDAVTVNYQRRKMFDDSLEKQLIGLAGQLKVNEAWDVASLLDLTVEQRNNKTFLSNEEIVQSCIVDNYDDFDHSTGQPRRAPFSHTLGQEFQQLKRLGELQRAAGLVLSPDNDMKMDIDGTDDLFDFDNFQLYSDMADFDIDSNTANIITQLQPMSELVPSLYAQGMNVPTGYQSTPTSSVASTGIGFPQMGYPTPTGINTILNQQPVATDPNDKLSVVMNFMNLIQNDPDCAVSDQTIRDITALYNSLIGQIPYTNTPT
ncbi:Protein PDC2 [Cyberlindnera fabianii]|uniref:Protein PDC2 n=1 Tax=Cyberlindnera fabianii TaxID=36022 RepID=A0A1V2LE52_CYBFA|nr:Protein PDC2 [Cyberlindnera fabianii]